MEQLKKIVILIMFVVMPGFTQAGGVEIWGSTSVSGSLLEPEIEDLQEDLDQLVHIVGVGSARGVIALASGKAQVAAVSDDFADIIEIAEREIAGASLMIKIPDDLQYTKIADERIHVIVHPSNSVDQLSSEQINDIFNGKIRNWSQLGGKDKELKVILTMNGSGTRHAFSDQLLHNSAGYADVLTRSAGEMLYLVSQHEGAIGIAGEMLMERSKLNVKIASPLFATRPFGLISYPSPSEDIAYIIRFYYDSLSRYRIREGG